MDSLLTTRIPNADEREKVLLTIFEAMREKSASIIRDIRDPRHVITQSFQQQVAASTYVAVITSTQVKVNLSKDGESVSLGEFLAFDLLDAIRRPKGQLKFYRFNFPLRSDCEVFWMGVKSAVNHQLLAWGSENQESAELTNEAVAARRPEAQILYFAFLDLKKRISNETPFDVRLREIQAFSLGFVLLLNRLRIIRVFATEEPIFAVPQLILEPADVHQCKLFSLVEDERSQTHIIQLSRDYTTLWRRFVWNKLLTSKNKEEIFFPGANSKTE
jgi:hypothetical protein